MEYRILTSDNSTDVMLHSYNPKTEEWGAMRFSTMSTLVNYCRRKSIDVQACNIVKREDVL